MVSDAAIRALFGTNLPTFLTGKNMGGFGANGNNNSWEITLPELGNLIMGGKGGMASNWEGGLQAVIKKNIKENGFGALVQMVTIPIAFRVGRRILNKPLILPANRVLKQLNLSKDVKF
jgi:hypothetical protein